MATSIGGFGSTVLRLAIVGIVVVNALAAAVVFLTRDRALVNRWTPRLLAANLFLIGAGAGIPIAAQALKLVVKAAAASQSTEIRVQAE